MWDPRPCPPEQSVYNNDRMSPSPLIFPCSPPTPGAAWSLGLISFPQLPQRNCNFRVDRHGLRTSHKRMINQTHNSTVGRKVRTLKVKKPFNIHGQEPASPAPSSPAPDVLLCVHLFLCPAVFTAVETEALAFSLGLSMARLLSGTARL